jgi:hypothetical protein
VDEAGAERELRSAMSGGGFIVSHVKPAATDLEMAFATLVPATHITPAGDQAEVVPQ